MNNNVRRQQITEAELRQVVRNMIIEEIENGQLDESFWNQAKTGVNSFFGKSPTKKGVEKQDTPTMNIMQRAKAGYNNFKIQGQQDNIKKAVGQIVSICQKYNIPTNKTIDELSQFGGGLQQRMASQSSQMKNNVQNIYR